MMNIKLLLLGMTLSLPYALYAADVTKATSPASPMTQTMHNEAEILIKTQQAEIIRLQEQLKQTQTLMQQRKIYSKIQQLLQRSSSEVILSVSAELLKSLQGYPLLPYAEYQWLSANKTQLDFASIQAFQRRYPDFPNSNELKKIWLQQQIEQQHWQAIVEHAAQLPMDIASRCSLWLAQQENSKTTLNLTALSTPKSAQKEVMFSADITKLWLTGDSLPRQCDPLLEEWRLNGGLTPRLMQQRALLAFAKNNRELLTYLEKQETNAENKKWFSDLNQLLQAPKNLQNAQNQFSIMQLNSENPQHQQILQHIFPAFVKTLKESDIKTDAPFAEFADWALRFSLTPSQVAQWKQAMVSQFFDSKNPQLQQWRDQSLLELKSDSLSERRIRTAIRKKQNLAPWLNLLSTEAKNKEEWRYWQAKVWQQQGKTAKAKQQWQAMQNAPRGFYPMLAAQELGIVYQPKMLNFNATAEQQTLLQKSAPTLAKIAELRYHHDQLNTNREWRNLLNSVNNEQKLVFAQYAAEQQWYDLQVEATIQAKAWDYLALRLPNAYQTWFDLWLNKRNIDRTFAMAIARQESAWRAEVSSSADARGLMQLLPATAKLTAQKFRLPYNNEKQLFDPIDNIMLGTTHLQELYDKYGNNRILIAAAYNAGARRVDSWLGKSQGRLSMAEFIASIPFYETRGYVQNVLAYAYYYQILQHKPLQKFTQEENNRLY
ncbi:transglycosylase SLT domain-containing protein [Actinobacillus seminis]|uniref:transglycosylase SLT domain-containing protein n=1 Tax=Actinobacillus seminis TaxID=722 RepID=UPI003B93AD36